MKIAHIVCAFPPYYSGMGNVVFETANELLKLGHEVAVFTPNVYEEKEIKKSEEPVEETHAEDLQERIDYVRRLTPSLQYGNAARLPQIKEELNDFDIIHLHYPFFGTAEIVKKWKKKNPHKPLVVTYHMDSRASGWLGVIFKIYGKLWLPKVLRSADAVITSSFDYLENSDASFICRENREKCFEIPFGVDIDRFTPRDKSLLFFENLKLNPDLPTILFVGGMDQAHYFKGIPVLLKALLVLKEKKLKIQAILVGDGELRQEYEDLASSYGLLDVLRFVGKVSEEDLPLCYNMADLLVLPSVTTGEAFGMVLLEAMSSGVPVIASDLPGVRSVASFGGLTFPPGDWQALALEIEEFFSGTTPRAEWRQKARIMAEEKFSWSKVTKELESVYLKVKK